MARIFLTSDMHYTDKVGIGDMAVADVLGLTQQQRLNLLSACIREENPDYMLILGDLSVDDAPWRAEKEGKPNYCEKYRREFLDELSVPMAILAGNHDSYADSAWQAMFGHPRQHSVTVDNTLFILLDTFQGPASNGGGSPYVGVDMAFLQEELDKAGNCDVYLCAHYFDAKKAQPEFLALLERENRIRALLQGHTHIRAVTAFGPKPLYDLGCFSYNCYNFRDAENRVIWDFNHYDPASAWGYGVLDTETNTLRYVYPGQDYLGSNGAFTLERHEIETKF